MKNIKFCSRCLLPNTSEAVLFDQDGICSVCNQIEDKKLKIDWDKRSKKLDELISIYKNKYDYDCIVPFSGGKDSTFTLWYLVKVKKLKPLVVRFDHGFLRKNLNSNSERAFKELGVDVLHFSPNWQVVKKLMYESLKRRGDFCWHCHTGIFSYPMWIAINFNVPLIFWGEPTAEYSSWYDYDDENLEEHDEERFNKFINLGINAEDMIGMLDDTISDYKITLRDLKPYTFPPKKLLNSIGVKSVMLGNFVPWDVKKQVEIIKNELGWKGDQVEGIPEFYDYEKIECLVQGVRDYLKYLKRGVGRTNHLVSIDIRNNRLSREDGEELIKTYDGKKPASLNKFLEILGINENQFMELVEPHVVPPHDFNSCQNCPKSNNVPKDILDWVESKY